MPSRRRIRVGLIVLAAVCVIGAGCRESGPERAAGQTEADTMSSAETSESDSTVRDTSGTDSDTVRRPGPIPPGPAPGTVRVRAVVASCDTTTTPAQCRLQIEEVLAYGSSTPPISSGERTVRLSETFLSRRTLDDLREDPRIYILHHAGDRPVAAEDDAEDERIEWTARSIDGN